MNSFLSPGWKQLPYYLPYSSYFFLTSTLKREPVASITPRAAVYPRDKMYRRYGGPQSRPAWTRKLEKKSSTSVGNQIPLLQSAATHYSDRATGLTAGIIYVLHYILGSVFRAMVTEAASTSDTSVKFHQSARRNSPEYSHLFLPVVRAACTASLKLR
jgi:hypothetical protein